MAKHHVAALAALLAGVGLTAAAQQAAAQTRLVQPERQLLGVALGRPQMDVLRRFGPPTEIQTVALAVPGSGLPDLGGGGLGGQTSGGASFGAPSFGGAPGFGTPPGGYPGAPGGYGGGPAGPASAYSGGGFPSAGGFSTPGAGAFSAPGFGGGSPGGVGAPTADGAPTGPGGVPMLPPGDTGSPGFPGAPGGQAGGPEYSNAVLWIYKRPNNVRYEFLINEDGRVAQISVAAPATKPLGNVRTSRGISIGSDFRRVIEAYGNPERHRLVPGFRFYEAYYTKSHHAAFTFDTNPKSGMRVARITIALAD